MATTQLGLEPSTISHLEALVAKDLNDLTKDDKGFLIARRDYLTREQKEDLKSVLEPKAVSKDAK